MANKQFDTPQSELSNDKKPPENNPENKYLQLYKIVRLMCDNVPDMIWAKDLDHQYTFANKEHCKSFLLTSDVNEPIGKTACHFFEIVKNEKPEDKDWYTIGDSCSHSDEFVYKYRKPIQVVVNGYVRGQFVELELSKAPFFDDDNNFIGIVGAGRDVTKRRQIEKELRYNEERIQLAMDSANLGVWDWDIEKGKLKLDRKWVNTFGYSTEEFDNDFSFFLTAIHPDDVEVHTDELQKHFTNQTSFFDHTFRVKTKDDFDYRWIRSRGNVVERNSNEEPTRMVGIHQDVTDSIDQQKKLKKALQKAEESDRLKTAFLSNLSHEIRTPLNSILGFTRFLVFEDGIPDSSKKEYMDIVESSSEYFLQVINNIIDIAKIESGSFKLDKVKFDLRSLCKDLMQKLRRQTHFSEKIKLNFTPEPADTELSIFSDRNVFEQIIFSLLSNAIKFTHEGKVELGYELIDNNKLFIYVKDSGIGIDLKYENVIYQPFRQLSDSFKREYGGAGLGLAIAYSMTELLNGKLWFESEKDKGTIFYVYIPV